MKIQLLRTLHIMIAVTVMVSLIVLTYLRNDLWHTKLALWKDTAEKSPMKSRVHNGVGLSYWLDGRLDEAASEFKKAHELDRAALEVYSNFYDLGVAYEERGNFFQAAYCYDIVCKSAPPLFQIKKQNACDRVHRFLQMKY